MVHMYIASAVGKRTGQKSINFAPNGALIAGEEVEIDHVSSERVHQLFICASACRESHYHHHRLNHNEDAEP